jgi:hypothetical protein
LNDVYETQDASSELLTTLVTSLGSGYNSYEVITTETSDACSAVLDAISSLMGAGYLSDASDAAVTSYVGTVSSFIDGAVSSQRGGDSTNTTSIAAGIDSLMSGLGDRMVDGEAPALYVTDNVRMEIRKSLVADLYVNGTFSLAPPDTSAESAYGVKQPTVEFVGENTLSLLCGFGEGYAEISTMKYGSNPYGDASNGSVASPLLRLGMGSGTESTVNASTNGSVLYYLQIPFATPKDFNFTLIADIQAGYNVTYDNFTFPECTTFNADSGTYTSCANCSVSSFTNYNMTVACYDMSMICPGTDPSHPSLSLPLPLTLSLIRRC